MNKEEIIKALEQFIEEQKTEIEKYERMLKEEKLPKEYSPYYALKKTKSFHEGILAGLICAHIMLKK